MNRPRRGRRPAPPRAAPRTARVAELLREIVAEELERIGDDRLELVTVTAVDVNPDLRHAVVSYDSLTGEDGDAAVLDALGDYRVRLQSAVGRQIRARQTPVLEFRPDQTIRSAERIDRILREQRRQDGDGEEAEAEGHDRPA